MYRCREAIEAFSSLPPEQYSTGWVLSCVGRAHAELVEYVSAERAFEWARRVCPHRTENAEIYSTVLWHLKKEVELSYLAQESVSLDRQSPHAWCAMGNCFSLQKEHESALRFFQRALQLDPSFAYAHTLCGHEYFANEDFEKAIASYRSSTLLSNKF
jgi:anaphase-promoting complex subunit 3